MRLYLLPVMGVCFAVDALVLASAGALTGRKAEGLLLSSALGALYGGACLLPRLQPLGGIGWRLGMLFIMGAVAFGRNYGSIALFAVLDLACGGLSVLLGGKHSALLSASLVAFLCLMSRHGGASTVPVTLHWEGRQEKVLALRDTGNGLRDPVTGEQVLVVGPGVAGRLLGLTRQQLAQPVQTLMQQPLPGLRLIPYRAVGGKGMLLALRLPQVYMGNVRRSSLVAFTPEGLDGTEPFEALTGGSV